MRRVPPNNKQRNEAALKLIENTNLAKRTAVGLVYVAGLITSSSSNAQVRNQLSLEEARQLARTQASKVLGIDINSIRLSTGAIASLKTTGRTFASFKLQGGARALQVDIDVDSGKVVETDLVHEEVLALRSAHKKMGESLSKRVADPNTRTVPVVLWLNVPNDDDTMPPVKASASRKTSASDAELNAATEESVARRSAATSPVRQRVLEILRKVDPAPMRTT